MLTNKKVLLSSVAFLTTLGGAIAADLPSRKSEPAEYMRVCDAYGSGFFFIPGTDTCLRVGGLIRGEYGYATSGNILTVPTYKLTAGTNAGVQALGVAGNTTYVPSGVLDQSGFTTRGYALLDARTKTSMGDVRSYIVIRLQTGTGLYSGADNYATNALTGQTGTLATTVEQAIVQFAGFTFGRTTRDVFSFMPGVALGSFSQSSYAGATNLLSYTANFGNGLSASLGLEDRAGQSSSNLTGYAPFGPGGTVIAAGAFSTTGATQTGSTIGNGPLTLPALAGNIRYEKDWGALQAMGIIQQNAATTNFTSVTAGGSPNVTLTRNGFAIGLGIKLNLPMLAAGDAIYATAAYADGDVVQLQSFGSSAVTSGFGREVPGLQRIDRDLTVTPAASQAGCVIATLTKGCFRTESTTGWSTAIYFNHYWTPTVRQWLFFSYWTVTPGAQTRNTDWTLGGLSAAQLFRVGTQTVWSPVKDLDLSAEVDYVSMRQTFAATSVANGGTGVATCQPGGPGFGTPACKGVQGVGAGGNVFEARMRAERRF